MSRRELRRTATVAVEGEVLAYEWVRVAGRRHVHLVISDGRLEVRTPWQCTEREACSALITHRAWARRGLERDRERRARRAPLTDGARLPLLDESLRLRIATQLDLFQGRRAWRDGGDLHAAPGAAAPLEEILRGWYRGAAEGLLPARVAHLAGRVGLWPVRVTVAAQRRRWGSCNARGALRLNWRLVLLPGRLADYVIVHELCHLAHLDHSRSFWARVAATLPDHAARRAALRTLEGELPL